MVKATRRYQSTGKPRGHHASYRLTPRQQELAAEYLRYAYKMAHVYSRTYHLPIDDCLSLAHFILVEVAHHFKEDATIADVDREPRFKFHIRRSLATAIKRLKNKTHDHLPFRDEHDHPVTFLDFDQIDGRLIWQRAQLLLAADRYNTLCRHLISGESIYSIGLATGVPHTTLQRHYDQSIAQLRLSIEQSIIPGISGMGDITCH